MSGHHRLVFEIVSREEELTSLRAFVGEPHGGSAGLVIEGEAGIGKSTLWLAGVEQGQQCGARVLSARPVEAERSLAYAGLGDLLESVVDEALPALTAPRRRALEVAMLRGDAAGDRVDQRAVGVAVRDVLQLLGLEEPVVVAVDDVQWLDPSSSSVLAFALRRLGTSHVLVLLARRLGRPPACQTRCLHHSTAHPRWLSPGVVEGSSQASPPGQGY